MATPVALPQTVNNGSPFSIFYPVFVFISLLDSNPVDQDKMDFQSGLNLHFPDVANDVELFLAVS